MDRSQMEMLSVKSAIERTLSSYVAVHTEIKDGYACLNFTPFIEDVERYVAAMFAGGQIERDFSVSSSATSGCVEVLFAVGQQRSRVTFLMPPGLRIAPPQSARPVTIDKPPVQPELNFESHTTLLPDVNHVSFDDFQQASAEWNQEIAMARSRAQEADLARTHAGDDAIDAYERAKKFVTR